MRGSQSQQSQNPLEPILTPEMSKRVDLINRSLVLYKEDLVRSIDPEHLVLQSLLPSIQHLKWELRKVKRELTTGARYVGKELDQIDSSMTRVETATKGLQETLRWVSCRMDRKDNRQT